MSTSTVSLHETRRAKCFPDRSDFQIPSYNIIRSALTQLAPDLRPGRDAADLLGFVARWGRVTAREAAEACDPAGGASPRPLEEAVAAGALLRDEDPPGWIRAVAVRPSLENDRGSCDPRREWPLP